MATETLLRVGNTYSRLQHHEASFDRSGTRRKMHDWILFLDVQDDSSIERVKFGLGATFVPSEFVCRSPVPTEDGWLRFSSRQQSFAFFEATIQVRGTGGSVMQMTHSIAPRTSSNMYTFNEYRPRQPLKPVKLEDEATFGIELELTVPNEISIEYVQSLVHGLSLIHI